jgi:hypothetical protein
MIGGGADRRSRADDDVKCSSSMWLDWVLSLASAKWCRKAGASVPAIASPLAWTAETPRMQFDLFFLPFFFHP